MIDAIFLLLASSIAQINTNVPIRTFRTVPTSTINFITGIIIRPPRTSSTTTLSTTTLSTTTLSTTTLSTTQFLTSTLSTTTLSLTTEPSDDDEQSIRDAIIVGTIWGAISLIILYVCCKKKKELEPIEPPTLENIRQNSFSNHVYAEIDDHPYEMPTILEEPYGQQVTAL